jgi:tRNA-dihydrouridine synthase B
VRGIDRTLERELPGRGAARLDQIFGGDPVKMADAAQIVEGMGADIVDVNMGCRCRRSRSQRRLQPDARAEHAQSVVAAMAKAVKIPVTVKMRAGWDADAINAPDLGRRMEDAGAAALAVHGRTAAQSYSGFSDWDLIDRVAAGVGIPVFGSGDCVEPSQLVERLGGGRVSGVLVGRGALRNPWIFEQAAALANGEAPCEVTHAERGAFLLEYIDLLLRERTGEAKGFRHVAPTMPDAAGPAPGRGDAARGHDRWVINKLRALNSWYTKGLDNGSHLRIAINSAESIPRLREIIAEFFGAPVSV